MKLMHSTDYKLYSSKIENDIRISLLSDLHFSYMIKEKKLDYILNYVIKIEPDYIIIDGDLIDSVDMILDINEQNRLISWIRSLSSVSKVIISLGSHDYTRKKYDKNNKMFWEYCFKKDFFNEINDISNVTLLNNSVYEDDEVCILGYTQSLKCYIPHKKEGMFKPVKEDKQRKKVEIKNLINKVGNISEEKLSLFLCHSPIYLTDDEFDFLDGYFDYYLSGHMHNGCVPPILYEIWKSNRGLIAPNKEFFPQNERNTCLLKGDKLIVNGPLTTFQECTGKLQMFNFMFPYYASTIDFTNDIKYDKEKVYVKRRYKS